MLRTKMATLVGAVLILMCGRWSPAVATTHSFDVVMIEGTIAADGLMFNVPGVGIEMCPEMTSISGTIDDTTGTMSGTLDFLIPFVSFLDDEHYVIQATGASTSHGSFDPVEDDFDGLAFDDITFVISTLDTEMCEPVEQVCRGTASLTLGGALYNGADLPLSTGDQIYINGIGSLSAPFSTCGFIWFFLLNGADLAISENTSMSPPPPGAIFEQV